MRLIFDKKKERARRRNREYGRKNLGKKRLDFYRVGGVLLILILIVLGIYGLWLWKNQPVRKGDSAAEQTENSTEEAEKTPLFDLKFTPGTIRLVEEIQSEYGILLRADTGRIIAERKSAERINPASMTKILTLLVAAEQISDKSGTFTMTREIADYCFTNDCSVVGYMEGEQIPIAELFYGCILCSGADASLALAELACGSHEAFVLKMNEKIKELGCADSANFTNCVGIYDENHYCTVQDMAIFMKAAMENDFCKKILSTKIYHSKPTEEHSKGQVLSNWFLRRIEDKDSGDVVVIGAKTGYVVESLNCAVSFGRNRAGEEFICVTGKGGGSWQAIYDHAALYKQYGGVSANY